MGSREIIVPDNLDDVNYSRAEATDAVTDVGLIGDSMVEGRNIEKRYNSSIGGSAVMVAYLLPSILELYLFSIDRKSTRLNSSHTT